MLFFWNMKTIEVYYNFPNIKWTPFCVGGLISIELSLKEGIKYKKKRKDNYFELIYNPK